MGVGLTGSLVGRTGRKPSCGSREVQTRQDHRTKAVGKEESRASYGSSLRRTESLEGSRSEIALGQGKSTTHCILGGQPEFV